MALGVYFLIAGLINFVIQPSMQRLMEDIQKGMLDYVLLGLPNFDDPTEALMAVAAGLPAVRRRRQHRPDQISDRGAGENNTQGR